MKKQTIINRVEKLGYWVSEEKEWNPSRDFKAWGVGHIGSSNANNYFITLSELEEWMYNMEEERNIAESLA